MIGMHFIDSFPPERVHFRKREKKERGERDLGNKLNRRVKHGQIFTKNNVQKLLYERPRWDCCPCLLWSWDRTATQSRAGRSRSQGLQAMQSPPPPTLPRNHRSFQSTPKFQLRVTLYPSQLGQHVFVQSKRHHMPRKSPEKGLYF